MDSEIARPTVAVIGAGRVGSALTLALHHAGYPIVAVASRTPEHAATLADAVGAPYLPLLGASGVADLTLLAVPDDAIARVARVLAKRGHWQAGQMVVHCSGALPAATLAPLAALGVEIGSWHPLAAFADLGRSLPAGVTFAIEAAGHLHSLLHELTVKLGGRPLDLHPADKPLYHAAAVLASNYTVVLAALAARLLESTGATPQAALDALLPLLGTTLENLANRGLPDGLTGPLVRGDAGTVARHLQALTAYDPALAEVYRSLGAAALPLVAGRHTPAVADQLAQALEPIVHEER